MSMELSRVLRFLATGLLNTAFGYACYSVLIWLGLPLWSAVTASTVLSVLFNFRSYGQLVFGDTSVRFLPRFLLFYGALWALNLILLNIMTELGLGPLLAQAILLPPLAGVSYFVMQSFIFRLSAQNEPLQEEAHQS